MTGKRENPRSGAGRRPAIGRRPRRTLHAPLPLTARLARVHDRHTESSLVRDTNAIAFRACSADTPDHRVCAHSDNNNNNNTYRCRRVFLSVLCSFFADKIHIEPCTHRNYRIRFSCDRTVCFCLFLIFRHIVIV